MPKWIARSRTVDAWHFNASTDVFPGWLCAAFLDGILVRESAETLKIRTLSGAVVVKRDDFVVRLSSGAIVSYHHDDFLSEFEPAPEAAPDRE